MGIEIREGPPMEPADLQALFEHAPWARGRTVAEIRIMLDNTDCHFSAWDGERLIGFARVLTDRIYRATLWDVVVHPDPSPLQRLRAKARHPESVSYVC